MLDFDDIKVSTTTIISSTNVEINLENFYQQIPVACIQVPRHFKRKKDIEKYINDQKLPVGTILNIEYKGDIKGFKVKKRKQWTTEPNRKYFRNTLSVVIIGSDNIFANVKIPSIGKLQITGCKNMEQIYECIKNLWSTIEKYPDVYNLKGTHFYTTMRAVMTNIDFKLGFEINRQKLDTFINNYSNFHSLLETSLGYTGINIKKEYEHRNTLIDTLEYKDGKWVSGKIYYNDYIKTLSQIERSNELNKKRKNTFLVFCSGTTIMSGMSKEYMRDDFHEFMKFIEEHRSEIEEKLL